LSVSFAAEKIQDGELRNALCPRHEETLLAYAQTPPEILAVLRLVG
jgi:hypothetical protein